MKKLWKRIPKGWKLAAELALLLALVFGCLCYQNWPRFSFEAAYRRVVAENLRPETPLSLRLDADLEGYAWAVGLGEDGTAREILLHKDELSWRTGAFLIPEATNQSWTVSATLLEFPETEGVCCVPLYWRSLLDSTRYTPLSPETPALALRTDAARAELRLTIEAYVPFPDYPGNRLPAGSCELVPLGEEEGWLLFGFDAATLEGAGDVDSWSVNRSLVMWLSRWAAAHANTGANYSPPVQAGRLELRLYDEAGKLTRTVVLEP